MSFTSPEFWIALLQIIGVNIVLSGDNAVVIALAARGLPPEHQKKAVAWGSGAAVVMRIVLTLVAVELLRLPYLKLAGAGLLMWIAIQLLLPGDDEGGHGSATTTMSSAIKTILLADLVMSLDNVIAVAAAAKGNTALLVIGLAISIPLVVFASRLLLTLMDRFPVIITMGAALLGWVAGDMAVTDPVDKPWVDLNAAFLHWGAPLACAFAVVALGKWLAARKLAASASASAARSQAAPALPVAAGTGWVRRVMVAVDGSEGAALALQRALDLRNDLRNAGSVELHLINVQRPVSGDVSSFVPATSIESYHHERSESAMAPARATLAAAHMPFKEHVAVGAPGLTIAEAARTQGCDLIVMGSRGLGTHTAALLGSVAQSVLEHATVPLLVAK